MGNKSFQIWSELAAHKGRPTFLLLESQITRRKSITYVLNEDEEILFASFYVSECIEWLISEEISSILAVTENKKVTITFTLIPEEKEV